jgi:hypothetical protein
MTEMWLLSLKDDSGELKLIAIKDEGSAKRIQAVFEAEGFQTGLVEG